MLYPLVAVRLPPSYQNTRGLQSKNYAKLAATPHRRNAVLVEQVTRRVRWKLEQARKLVYEEFQINLHTASINRATQSLHAEKW
jgi:hypothetical protein